jgi:hypothetical protein
MANVVYDNFYLSNEVEDQFNSHLNLQPFCTIDNNLQGEPGMLRKINVYQATDGTQKLEMGEGNTTAIEVSYAPKEYRILLAQNKFLYYDEQSMTDPMLVPVGTRHMGTDMFNTVNADIFREFKNATLTHSSDKFDFDALVDGVAKMEIEELEGVNLFGFVHPKDVAKVRKELLGSLQYVEAFARSGYMGTVAGINLYTKQDADEGTIIIASREAVTLFVKTGTQIEQERDADTRQNKIFSRKYYLAALTNETRAVRIILSSAAAQFKNITMNGTPIVGSEIGISSIEYTKSVNENNVSLAYQWYVGPTAVGPYTKIASATSATFTPTAAQVDKFIRVEVTATGEAADVRMSNARKVRYLLAGEIVAFDEKATVTVKGTAKVGETLTSEIAYATGSTPVAPPTLVYEWQKSDNGTTGWTAIDGADDDSYEVEVALFEKYIRLKVVATGTAVGTKESAATDQVVAANGGGG